MNIVDAQGKLFGKINIIDFAIIVFAIIVIVGGLFGYKAYKSSGKEQLEDQWTRISVKFSGVIPELSRVLKENDIEYSKSGAPAAKLEKILVNKQSEVLQFLIQENKFITVPNPVLKDILTSVQIHCYKRNNVIYYKKLPLRIGDDFTFTADEYSVRGIVTSLSVQ